MARFIAFKRAFFGVRAVLPLRPYAAPRAGFRAASLCAAAAAAAAATAAAGCAVAPLAAEAPAPGGDPFGQPIPRGGDAAGAKRAVPGGLGRFTVADAVARVTPSVVKVRAASVSPGGGARALFGLGGGGGAAEVSVSHGSGFVIGAEGRIVTCAHVVHPHGPPRGGGGGGDGSRAAAVTVTLDDGRSFAGVVEAADARSDIAVVRVTDPAAPVLRPVAFADSAAARAGEFVVSVGAPLTLAGSCSFGIISCIQRDLGAATGAAGDDDDAGLGYFQTDLAINAGSSGGPLVSLDGEVLGVCSKKVQGDVEGIAFAVPINYARQVVAELCAHGAVRRPFLGLVLIALTPRVLEDIEWDRNYAAPPWLRRELEGLNESSTLGLMVHGVTKGGPAHRAGIRAGDVVVAVDGVATRSTSEFLANMSFKVEKNVVVQFRKAGTGEVTSTTVRPEALADT